MYGCDKVHRRNVLVFTLSMFFFICVERLNATFITNKFGIQHLTSNSGIMIAFIAFHLKSVIHIIGEVSFITRETFQCNIVESSDSFDLILTSIPAALLCIAIVFFLWHCFSENYEKTLKSKSSHTVGI